MSKMAGTKTNLTTAMAIAGRDSRACDGCGSQRARWFCAADNAHLCHRCDQNVHSANALAHRHERVKLQPHSPSPSSLRTSSQSQQPSGPQHHPRPLHPHSLPSRKRSRLSRRPNPHLRAPTSACLKAHPSSLKGRKVKGESRLHGDGHRDGTHEVPTFITVNIQESPVGFHHDQGVSSLSMAEYCKGKAAAAVWVDACEDLSSGGDSDQFLVPTSNLESFEDQGGADGDAEEMGSFGGEIPFDMGGSMDLSDEDYNLNFSDIVGLQEADAFEGECGETSEVGGKASKEEEGFGAQASCDYNDVNNEAQHGVVPPFTKAYPYKVKTEYASESLDFIKKEVAEVLRSSLEGGSSGSKEEDHAKHAMPSLLRLNYEDVLSAWSENRSLWTDGKRPQTVPEDSNSEALGGMDIGLVPDLSTGGPTTVGAVDDRGREARVMRYREKRRTRLFSKKIRYEVRKLNAERRPRMKGRFVKRTPGCT